MDFVNQIWNDPEVMGAAKALVMAVLAFVAAYMREQAVRIAAHAGAMHAETVAEETGAKGPEKMDLAEAHASRLLGRAKAGSTRTRRIIEQEIPEARKSIAPPNGH